MNAAVGWRRIFFNDSIVFMILADIYCLILLSNKVMPSLLVLLLIAECALRRNVYLWEITGIPLYTFS